MLVNIDDIYRFDLELIRKNQSGGLSGTEFNDFYNDHQYAYFQDLIGRFNARNNSKEGSNIGLIQTEVILTKLAPFTIAGNIVIAGGVAVWPTDFHYKMALRINGFQVNYVKKNGIARMLKDPIDPPSASDNMYYYTEYEDTYKFYPNTVTAAELDYIRLPKQVKWGFTFDSDGRELYDSNASVDSEWDIPSTIEISKRMLTDIGVSYKDSDFAQFGNAAVVTGE